MVNIVSCIIKDDRILYLSDIYPINWKKNMNSAFRFTSFEEARANLNLRFIPLVESIKNNNIKSIQICSVDLDIILESQKYI